MINRVINTSMVFLVFVIPLTLFLVACDTGTSNSGTSNPGTPVQTIGWEEDGDGFRQFYTNDAAFASYVFWHVQSAGYNGIAEIELKKVSGSIYTGYGIVFDYVDAENFSAFAIYLTGEYVVWRLEAGIRNFITGDNTTAITTEHNAINTIRTEVADGLTVWINGTAVYSEDDYTSPEVDDLWVGAFVGVGPSEDFPDTPVDVRYRRTQP